MKYQVAVTYRRVIPDCRFAGQLNHCIQPLLPYSNVMNHIRTLFFSKVTVGCIPAVTPAAVTPTTFFAT